MKTKLKYLTKISLARKIKTKWFLVANVLLLILIVGLINIDSIIKLFGGDFNQIQEVYVIDNSNKTYETLKYQLKNSSSLIQTEDVSFKIKKTNKTAEEVIKDKKEAWVLIINNDRKNIINAKLVSKSYISATDYATFTSILNNTKSAVALTETNISQKQLAQISDPIKIERQILDKSKKGKDENSQLILQTAFPIFIFPFFALTLFLVQMIGAEVNDEKTTRGMEIIISNVSPKVHLISKIISANLFVIIQGLLLVLFAIIGIIVRFIVGVPLEVNIDSAGTSKIITAFLTSDVASQLTYVIPLTIIMMLLTFIAYSLLAGVLASMTTNIEDFQQLQTPIMVISLLGYYLSIMAGMFEGSIFIKIFAFIPFISAILAPCLLVLGQFTLFEFVVAILLVIVVIYLLVKYGFRIYKQGILNYSSKNLWKKMFKALKSE